MPLTNEYLKKLLSVNDKILIIGLPRAGKTTLFNTMVKLESIAPHFHLQTDDYKKFEYVKQLYMIMDELREEVRWLVEGVQGYRLMRKYAQLQDLAFKPDLIIIVIGEESPLKKHKSMNKALKKIWQDFIALETEMPIIEYHLR